MICKDGTTFDNDSTSSSFFNKEGTEGKEKFNENGLSSSIGEDAFFFGDDEDEDNNNFLIAASVSFFCFLLVADAFGLPRRVFFTDEGITFSKIDLTIEIVLLFFFPFCFIVRHRLVFLHRVSLGLHLTKHVNPTLSFPAPHAFLGLPRGIF